MKVLAVDIGSSSAKAALVVDGQIVGRIGRAAFPTQFDGPRVTVATDRIYDAAITAMGQVDARRVDALALTSMAPAWVALDRRGEALTDLITHADRSSIRAAHEIEAAIGRAEHLRRVGNRPFPGGISSTTCKMIADSQTLENVDLVGHLPTLFHRSLTGERVMDTSNAGFTGLWRIDGSGWDAELIELVGLRMEQLPRVVTSGELAGRLLPDAARMVGLPEGLPVSAGMVDGSGAMILAGAAPGQLVNSAGSTDVLAVCLDHPEPRADLLTRPLGIDGKWVSVATEAAAGSTIDWARRELFRDLDDAAFGALLADAQPTGLQFDPRLAGSRTDIDQPTGSIAGLTLGTTREEMLHAILAALARSSRDRLAKLESLGTPLLPEVILTGGGATPRPWADRFLVRVEEEATLRGAALALER